MQILAFTDIHGAFGVVENILAVEPEADVVLLGGDLTTFGSSDDVRTLVTTVRRYCSLVFAIGGNMDPLELEATMRELDVSINGTGRLIGDVGFFGISGAPISPLHTPHELPEAELEATGRLGRHAVENARVRILVSHAPPLQTSVDRLYSGRHVGSSAVRRVIEATLPDLVVCGHIHESHGVTAVGSSRVVNCGSAAEGRYLRVAIDTTIVVEPRIAARKW